MSENSFQLSELIRAFPYTWKPLLEYHDRLLRHNHGPFTVGERELIAAYTSGLNQCDFCFGAHTIIAETFGFQPDLIKALLENLETAPMPEPFLLVLKFVKKLTLTPSKLTEQDRQILLDAGWSEQAIHDAAAICGLFNLMNRIVEGTGVTTSAAIQLAQKERHAQAKNNPNSYQDFGRLYCGIE